MTTSSWLLTAKILELPSTPLFLSLPTSNTSENPIGSTSKICPGSDYFSPPLPIPQCCDHFGPGRSYYNGLLTGLCFCCVPFQTILNTGASVILLKCKSDPSPHKSLRGLTWFSPCHVSSLPSSTSPPNCSLPATLAFLLLFEHTWFPSTFRFLYLLLCLYLLGAFAQ